MNFLLTFKKNLVLKNEFLIIDSDLLSDIFLFINIHLTTTVLHRWNFVRWHVSWFHQWSALRYVHV